MGNDEIKKVKAIKYFSDFRNVKTSASNLEDDQDLKEQVNLIITINNCNPKYKYQFSASSLILKQKYTLINSNIQSPNENGELTFEQTLVMEYFFEKEQTIVFDFYIISGDNNSNNISFEIVTSLGAIVGSRKNTLIRKLSENTNEEILIKADKLKESKGYLNVQFDINSNIPLDLKEGKNKIFYLISNKNKIYSSEALGDNGKFTVINIPINLLTPNFKIQFFDCQKKCVGNIQTTLEQFSNKEYNEKNKINLILSKKRTLILTNRSFISIKYTFLDYLKSGVRLGLSIGIDFTGSNGHPYDEDSLHRTRDPTNPNNPNNNKGPNDYERAIYSCGNIVAYYDYDQLFPVFGFGAIINSNSNEANMCFNINFKDDPNIYTINNILIEYQNCLQKITFSGPTLFTPIIKRVIEIIKENNNVMEYQILMILTDGVINDMQETIDALVEGSFLPLSVIIIGIGDADFSNMDILDGDDVPLISSKGVKRMRDLVQFVPFKKFENNSDKLSAEVLEEIPRQIEEYYSMNNLYPISLKDSKVENYN